MTADKLKELLKSIQKNKCESQVLELLCNIYKAPLFFKRRQSLLHYPRQMTKKTSDMGYMGF